MSIPKTILDANLSIEQILVVYNREVETARYGYMGTVEITYNNGECIELDHLKQTLAVYNPTEDHFKMYYWWSGCQQWKEFSK
jgi:hypothetical protein